MEVAAGKGGRRRPEREVSAVWRCVGVGAVGSGWVVIVVEYGERDNGRWECYLAAALIRPRTVLP